VNTTSQLTPDGLGESRWHQRAGDCDAPPTISNPPRFEGKPTSTNPGALQLQISTNNLLKRVKRVAFGMRRFRNYRIRALLYAGRPNLALLGSITPP
jgi:hypothetical protein